MAHPIRIAMLLAAALFTAATPPTDANPLSAPSVDRSHAIRTLTLVEDWLRAGQTAPSPNESPINATGIAAVRVTLRWSGLLLAAGQSENPTPTNTSSESPDHPPTPSVDLVPLARAATDAAFGQLIHRLRDAQLDAATTTPPSASTQPAPADSAPPPDPTDHAALIRSASHSIQVDIQIARTPDPITLPPKAAPTDLYHQFAPGYHGLRMRAQTDSTNKPNLPPATTPAAWLWPADALAANLPPDRQITRLLAQLDLPTDTLPNVAHRDGIPLDRFQVIHLTRPTPDAAPIELSRGRHPLPPTSLSTPALDQAAARLTTFLLRRQNPQGQFAGTYHPSADWYNPPTASIEDSALAVYALAQRAAYLAQAHAHDDHARTDLKTLEDAIGRGLDHLAHVLETTPASQPTGPAPPPYDAPTPASALAAAKALTLLTLADAPDHVAHKPLRDRLAHELLALRHADASFRTTANDSAAPLSNPTQALITAALAALLEQTRDPQLAADVIESQDALWESSRGRVPGTPWGAITEFRLRRSGLPDRPAAIDRWQRHRAAITEHTAALRTRQITAPPEHGPDDVVGGIESRPTPPDSPPNPDWTTARSLALLAAALRQPDVVEPNNRIDCLLDCGLAARFLTQLMFDETACYYARNRDDAIGGIKLAPWDNRLATGPAAMTLLAFTELQQSIQMIEQEMQAKPETQSTPAP